MMFLLSKNCAFISVFRDVLNAYVLLRVACMSTEAPKALNLFPISIIH
jgi:hypothetical protein